MWPSEPPRRYPSFARAAISFSWFVALHCATPAVGHTLTVTRGTVTVDRESVTLRISIDIHQLSHSRPMRAEDDGTYSQQSVHAPAVEYGSDLLSAIRIRDPRGEVLSGRVASCRLEGAGDTMIDHKRIREVSAYYVFSYELPKPVRYLSFQLDLRDTALVAPTQIVLAVQSTDETARVLCLTSGGNIEVVSLAANRDRGKIEIEMQADWRSGDADGSCRPVPFVLSDALRSVRSLVYVENEGVRIELFIPVRVVETWLPIRRTRRDFIEVPEQSEAASQLEQFFASHNPMQINAVRAAPRITRLAFLDFGDAGLGEQRIPRRLSAWTSRLHVSMVYDSTERPRAIDLHWDLFNAAVLTANVLVVYDGGCLERDLSTYEPHLTWHRN